MIKAMISAAWHTLALFIIGYVFFQVTGYTYNSDWPNLLLFIFGFIAVVKYGDNKNPKNPFEDD